MLIFVKRLISRKIQRFRASIYVAESERICREEFTNQTFMRLNERPIELAFVFSKLGMLYPRTVLDVGSGTTALPHLLRNCGCLVTAIDNVKDYWPRGMHNRHYHVINDDITAAQLKGEFDLITCISVLEHIQKCDVAVRNMFALIRPGGHLILTFPYNEQRYISNVYALPGSTYGRNAPYVGQAYSRSDVDRWLRDNSGIILDQQYWQFWDGEYWTEGKQIVPPICVNAADRHQLSCILIRKGQCCSEVHDADSVHDVEA